MKKIISFILISLIFILALAACGGESTPPSVEAAEAGAEQTAEVSATAVTDRAAAGTDAELTTDFSDALSLDLQLAFGTIQLENTDLAVTAEQAEVILPYWRVLQSLKQTDNTADAEINAVVRQIQNGMSGEQIAAIAALELTQDKVQAMIEEGAINFGRGSGAGAESGGAGVPLRPGGGLLGGGPGGGAGGGPGGLGGDPGAFATRQAELEASGEDPMAAMMDRISANMVIRLLETRTGEAPAGGFGAVGAALTVASELTGLTEEELGAALAEGQTLGEILEANGVSIDEAKEALKEALADVPLPGDQAQASQQDRQRDLDSWIDGILSGTFGADRTPDMQP